MTVGNAFHCFDPPCDIWEDYEKPRFIEETIKEVCDHIARKGDAHYNDIYDLIYEHIEDNIEKFLPEPDYDDF